MTPGSNAPARISSRHLLIVLAATLAVVSAVYVLRPVKDPDLFWHLKTGEWIWEQRRLPESDPFSYANAGIDTPSARFILSSYWGCQLIFNAAHALGGMGGIVLLRLGIWAALLAVVWMRREGDAPIDAALLLVFAVLFLERYPVERPQVLSFLGLALLLRLLDGLKTWPGPRSALLRGHRGPVLVALLMLVWANLHGGVALGQAVIAGYLVAEGVKFAHGSLRPIGREAYRSLLIAGAAGLAASLLNPNWHHTLDFALSAGTSDDFRGLVIAEYASIPMTIERLHDYTKVVVLALMALAAVAAVSRPRSIDLTEFLICAATAYFAFAHIRFVPVFMIAALPLTGRFLASGAWLRPARVLAAVLALALAANYATDERGGIERLRSGAWVDSIDFPVEAAEFIAARNPPGRMYNYYGWGGYLLWRLGPEKQVFVDGRNINPDSLWEASIIDSGAGATGEKQWESLLDKHGVTYAVLPIQRLGKPIQLVKTMLHDPNWAAVFKSENSVIFARRRPRLGGTPER